MCGEGHVILVADDQSIRIDRGVMRGAHVALRHVALERAVIALLGSAEGLSRANYVAMDALIMDGRTGSGITLPRGLRMTCLSGSQAVLSIGEPSHPHCPCGGGGVVSLTGRRRPVGGCSRRVRRSAASS